MVRHHGQTARVSACVVMGLVSIVAGSCGLGVGDSLVDIGRGPIRIHVPDTYDPGMPTPLVIVLHGYSGNSLSILRSLNLRRSADENRFIYSAPDGTVDSIGNQFWNATDACCDFGNLGIDDSAYLRTLIETIARRYNVDDRRIYIAGLSNGGFMAYRMACDHSDLIAGIVSMAGATFHDVTDCTPSEPVHVLQIHGTDDDVIRYSGNFAFGVPYPGAIESVEIWAAYNGCELLPEIPPGTLDLDASIPGEETTIRRYPVGCAPGGSAEHWRVRGGRHLLGGSQQLGEAVVQALLAHEKPANTSEPVAPE